MSWSNGCFGARVVCHGFLAWAGELYVTDPTGTQGKTRMELDSHHACVVGSQFLIIQDFCLPIALWMSASVAKRPTSDAGR